ncbi:MAG TPA: hypothetical protein VIS94_13255 [Desulfomonilia bacterium]
MKKHHISFIMVLAYCVFLSAAAFGFDQPGGPPRMSDSFMAPPSHVGIPSSVNPGIKLLNEAIQTNVLAELTGLSQENIRQMLISSPPQAILNSYGVAPEAFGTAMDKQTAKLVTQAAAAGVITKKQADDIQKKLNMKPSGPCPSVPSK